MPPPFVASYPDDRVMTVVGNGMLGGQSGAD